MMAGSYRSSSPARRPGSSLSGRHGSRHLCSVRKSTAGLHNGPRSHRTGLHTHTCKVWGSPWASHLQRSKRKEKSHYMGFISIRRTRLFLQDHYSTFTKQKVRPSIIIGRNVHSLLFCTSHLTNHPIIITSQYEGIYTSCVLF